MPVMSFKLAISNQKGGVGKTTIAINVAGALAQRHHDVLLLDLDPQGHATEGLGLEDTYDATSPTIYDHLTDPNQRGRLDDLIHQHREFDVLPANIDLFNAEAELTTVMRGRERLQLAIDTLNTDYDVVLIDCPPSLGYLTDNALLASQNVLVPALADGTSVRALELLYDQIESLEHSYDAEITDIGVVANRVEPDGESDAMMDWFNQTYSGSHPVWEVRKRVALQRAWSSGLSIFAHDESCDMESVFSDIAAHIEEVYL